MFILFGIIYVYNNIKYSDTAAQLPRQMSNVKSENYGSMCGIFWQLCGLLTSTFCVVLIDIIGLAWCIPLLNTICDTNQAPGINLSIIQIVVYGSSIQIMVAFIVFIIGAFAWCIDNAKEDGCDEEILNRLWIAALIFIIFSTLILGSLAIIGLIIRFNPEYSLNLCKPHINTFSAIWCIFKIVFPLCFCWTCFV